MTTYGDALPALPALDVLIVDDELNIRKTLGLCIEAEGHRVVAVSNEKDALAEVGRSKLDLVFLDMRLGATDGIDLIPRLLRVSPRLKIIVITAYASIDTAVEAMRRGATDYLAKPFAPAQIVAALGKVATLRALERRVRELEAALGRGAHEAELQTHSAAMERALELARSVAPSDASILLTGESGTGKGVFARAIHGWSKRAKSDFAVVSCPSLSAELLESELFGHVKGAFTGAIRQNPGRIAACDGGTLFLDEIGDLPLALQPKLLRFLQDREYEMVGDPATRRADVRVIAATNADLKAAVAEGRFREDLLYRLNVIHLRIPALRERAEDIVVLAERFLAAFRGDKNLVGFTPDALARLTQHPWPGNVRELRNVIERATIVGHGPLLDATTIALEEPGAVPPQARVGDMISLEAVEEAHIRRVLAAARSVEKAARILEIDAATLWRRRKKYGI